jgi:quercetin dioxygenase-like cupin family protein
MIKHHSAGGVYMREQTLAAGQEVEKHEHSYDHLSFLCWGSATLEVDGELQFLQAPCAIEIKAGKKHRIQALSDITWLCIHAESVADPEVVIKE